MSLLKAEHISLKFGSKAVLVDVNLTVNRGEIVTVIGPNGAGKSSLVRVVLGLIKPTRGQVSWEPGIKIGYMPQKINIEPYLPLSVLRFLQIAGGTEALDLQADASQNMMGTLKIHHLLKEPIQQLSGGEFQRVLLARALLRKPDFLVLDEPLQGVDIASQGHLYTLIGEIRDQYHCGILMVSHDLHFVMAGTDAVICLNHHVCCSGKPETVSKHPEFLSLFGLKTPFGIAVYAHDHDHAHDHHHNTPHNDLEKE